MTERGGMQVLERFECPICLACLKNPLLTTCGHRFCHDCIHEWLQRQGSNCPIDGQVLDAERDLFADNYTRREIQQLMVVCPVKDCGERLALTDAERHVAQIHGSQQLLAAAYSKKNVNGRTTDTLAWESEMWSPAPKQLGGSCELQGSRHTCEGLMRTLYERIVLLEQTSREQGIQIANHRAQLEELRLENEDLKAELPLRICGGDYIWTVELFTPKFSAMSRDLSTIFYSPGFYTSYTGYKFCVRLNLSIRDRDYLTLLIHLMKGSNDHVLDWPFQGRISFTLVHPTNCERSVKETMMSRPELEAFKRPLKEISPRGFGYTDFVLASDVLSQGYLKDDCLVIKVKIQTV